MPPKTRIKTTAATYPVPNTRDEAAAAIREIGDLNREHARLAAEMNDHIAVHTAEYQPRLDALANRIKAAQAGVHTWCEANRAELTQNGKSKTANLVTGEVSWRARPPSVRVTGAEAVIEWLKQLGLGRFVRTKEEINKEAILADPDAVAGVAGISISSGVEDFVIVPFEAGA